MNTARLLKRLRQIVYVAVLILLFIVMMFPFFFLLITSLKFERDVLVTPINYFPIPITFDNYILAWRDSKFAVYFFNTLIVAAGVLLLVSVISVMSGYALSRYRFRARGFLTVLLLMTQMVPSTLLLVPMFTIMQALGLINSLTAVILASSASLLAYCSILMRGFFSNISVQIEEAAWIDGCSKWQAVWHVVMPLLLPGLVATGAYAFVNAWNQFLLPLILLTDPDKFTLILGVKSLIGQYTINYARLSAAGVICLIPAILMFAYIQKHLVSGLTSGAVKG